MTILKLCPYMEQETKVAVERANDLPADGAIEYLDGFLLGIVRHINTSIDNYVTGTDCEDVQNATVEWVLGRWGECRDHLRAMRFSFWMEKWFPFSIWEFDRDN